MPSNKIKSTEMPPLAAFSKVIADAAKSLHANLQKVPGAPVVTKGITHLGEATKAKAKRVPLISNVATKLDKITKTAPLIRNVRKGIEASALEEKKNPKIQKKK